MMRGPVYFDCNATTPVLPSAADAALQVMKSLYGNPSSTHLVGLQAKQILESTRKLAGQAIGAEPDQIVFTSGATESIQMALFSALLKLRDQLPKAKLLYGATEHKVVPQALYHWVNALQLPYEIEELPVDAQGQIQLEVLENLLPEAGLLCTMAVNNETGVIQNLSKIETLLRKTESKALWLVDCVQALGKIPLRLESSRIDYAAFSGHKLYAPKGIGFLYRAKTAPLTPLIVGGGQEKGFRSGTENLPGVAALGIVLQELLKSPKASLFQPHERLFEFRNLLIHELKAAFPRIEFNTPLDCSVPTTLNFSIHELNSNEALELFDSAGLRVSAGSACSSASPKPSHVLTSMGIQLENCSSAIRLSFGPYTQESEIKRACQLIREASAALKSSCLLERTSGFPSSLNNEILNDGLIQFRAGSTNSWLVVDRSSRTCILIDPSDSVAERMEQFVRCQKLTVLAILDTHSHADHESTRPVLQKLLADQMLYDHVQSDELGWPLLSLPFKVTLENGMQAPALRFNMGEKGTLILAKIATPGHTGDSHTFLLGNETSEHLRKSDIQYVFSGDAILSGGLGRTNFVSSDSTAMFNSLRTIQEVIEPTTLICPAHDYNNSFATCLRTEVKENTLLALALAPASPLTLEQFLVQKAEMDLKLAQLEEDFQEVVCGVTGVNGASECASIPSNEFRRLVQQEKTRLRVIDVREPQEHYLSKNWKSLGLSQPPENIPLTRLTHFMDELLHTRSTDKIILICRSGKRSAQAVRSLRRLGFNDVWNVEGGLALADKR